MCVSDNEVRDITASAGARGSEGRERWVTACDERMGEEEEEE